MACLCWLICSRRHRNNQCAGVTGFNWFYQLFFQVADFHVTIRYLFFQINYSSFILLKPAIAHNENKAVY